MTPDELLARYHEASAQDPRRPAQRVGDAVRGHAQTVIGTNRSSAPVLAVSATAPANQSRWKLSMLASLAIVGLAGLLVLQFDRGTPQEKELVAGANTAGIPKQPQARAPEQGPPAKAAASDKSASVDSLVVRSAPAGERKAAPVPAARQEPLNAQVDVRAPSAEPGLRKDESAPAPSAVAAAVPPPAPAARAGALSAAPLAGLADASPARQSAQPSAELAAVLFEAARSGRIDEIDRLLAQGASIDARDAAGRTPLMLAAINGHADAVRRLLGAGANAALRDREGLSALQHARRLGQERIAALIEAGR